MATKIAKVVNYKISNKKDESKMKKSQFFK